MMQQQPILLFPTDASLVPSAQADLGTIAQTDRVVHVTVRKSNGKEPWTVNVKTPFFPAIRKDDLLHVVFEIRCLQSVENRGNFRAYLQVDNGPWEGLGELSGSLIPDGKWSSFHIAAKATKDYDAGAVNLVWHLATIEQTLEIRSVVGKNLGNRPISAIPINPVTYPGREPDAPWRKEAARRIEKHRKGPLSVVVTDRAGKPLRDVEVSVELKRHAYAFGSFTDLEPARDSVDSERYRKTLETTFNRVTIPWYWSDWGLESQKTRADYQKIATWAQNAGFEIKAHCLIYPTYLPTRVKKLSSAERRIAILKQVVEGISETQRYGVVAWDILNELRDNSDLEKEYGFDFYAEIFRTARKTAREPKRFINEYGVEAVGGSYEEKLTLYEAQIARQLKNGAPLDGIAVQGHFGADLPSLEEVWKALDRLAKFRLPIEVSELDLAIRDEAAQADYLRDYITACFAHPATTGVTLWGFWEGSIWRKEAALIRQDWSPKPAWLSLTTLLHKTWTTRASGRTDHRGQFSTRGFYGRYDVVVQRQGMKKKVSITHRSDLMKPIRIAL